MVRGVIDIFGSNVLRYFSRSSIENINQLLYNGSRTRFRRNCKNTLHFFDHLRHRDCGRVSLLGSFDRGDDGIRRRDGMDPVSFGLGLVAGILLAASTGATLVFFAALRVQGLTQDGIHDVIDDSSGNPKK